MTGGQRGRNLVFVGGCPRSGTTLVQLILDSHPNVCGGPEFDRVPEIVGLRDKLRASVDSGRISVYCSKEDVDREIGSLVERLLAPYAERRNCELISEKTPWYVLMFEELLEIFPGARFIFCVRDPRAVVASMLRVGSRAKEKGQNSPGFTKNVYSAIRTVKTTNDAGFGAASRSDRVLTVVYERLVDEPERETRRMCDFLGVPWSEEMLRPGEKRHDGEKTLDGVWYTDDMFYSNPDPGRARMERSADRRAARPGCDVVQGRREPQSSRLRAFRGGPDRNDPSRFQSEAQSLYWFERRVRAARLVFDAEPPLEATREEAELASWGGATPTLLSGSVTYFSGDQS